MPSGSAEAVSLGVSATSDDPDDALGVAVDDAMGVRATSDAFAADEALRVTVPVVSLCT